MALRLECEWGPVYTTGVAAKIDADVLRRGAGPDDRRRLAVMSKHGDHWHVHVPTQARFDALRKRAERKAKQQAHDDRQREWAAARKAGAQERNRVRAEKRRNKARRRAGLAVLPVEGDN